MDFSALWLLPPHLLAPLQWLWPVAANAARLLLYWGREHQMWWAITALLALVGYWFWEDNRQ